MNASGRHLVGLLVALVPTAASAGDIGHAIHFVDEAIGSQAIEGWEDQAESMDGSLHALIEARNASEDRPLEDYNCWEDSRTNNFWTLTPDYVQNRYVARSCFEHMWARSSLPGYKTLGEVRLSSSKVKAWVDEAAHKNGLEPILLDSMMRYASGFRPHVVADDGRVGIMQLPEEVARRFGADNPLNPEQSIRAGARYMRFLIDKWEGSLEFALAEYRSSEARIRQANGMPKEKHILLFVREVRNIHNTMTEAFPEELGWENVVLVATWLD
jgi:hypothetical protein